MSSQDQELLSRFDDGTLSPTEFRHADHIHVAWLCLHRDSLPHAIGRFCAGLLRMACAAGKPELYHETITWAYLLVIHERMRRHPELDWEGFRSANSDLFRWPGVLERYYQPATLQSTFAREVFVFPDR